MKFIQSILVAQLSLAAAKVLYYQENNVAGNFIVASNITATGVIARAVKTYTGGKGLAELFAASQDSVKVSGNYLFTVNSGDNTVSFFVIDPKKPLHPTLIGKPAPTLGRLPISVTYSHKIKTACVVNGDANVPGVACYDVDPVNGLTVKGRLRKIPPGKPAAQNSSPAILTGDIRFDPSSTAVFTSVANQQGGSGSIFAYPVFNGNVSTTAVVSTLQNVSIPFSLNFLRNNNTRLVITNPHQSSPGALLGAVTPADKVNEAKIVTVPGQIASCWIAEAPTFDALYVADAARPVFTVLDPTNFTTVQQFNFSTPGGGATDSVLDNQYLYTVTDPLNTTTFASYASSPQILVFDVKGAKQGKKPTLVQRFDIFSAIGKVPGIQGLAKYPADHTS